MKYLQVVALLFIPIILTSFIFNKKSAKFSHTFPTPCVVVSALFISHGRGAWYVLLNLIIHNYNEPRTRIYAIASTQTYTCNHQARANTQTHARQSRSHAGHIHCEYAHFILTITVPLLSFLSFLCHLLRPLHSSLWILFFHLPISIIIYASCSFH